MDNGFAKAQADYDAQMPPEDGLAPFETRVLRAVVYLTYNGRLPDHDYEESIEESQSPSEAEKDIAYVLERRLAIRADHIDVVDAEYMSVEEADNYGVPADVLAAEAAHTEPKEAKP